MTEGRSALRRVGPYELLTQIGEGGMGVVHLARRPGGDRVALKVLRPHIVGDEEARARLAREVASLRRIRSRWVAEIVDADPWAEVPYIATRYVPGHPLHDHVREEGPLDGSDLLWFAGGLAEGLAAVHGAGVLHRDVKPSNVLMEGRTPILIDFGLARVADDPKLTQTGWLLGTPGYLAPEILYGDDATAASDVHSWAATVAYAGTGRPPFGRGPSAAVMDRVRRGEHDLVGLPGELGQVVAAALDPDPQRRPTLAVILTWLRARAAGEAGGPPVPTTTPPPTLAYSAVLPAAAPLDLDYPVRVPLAERARRALLLLGAAAACAAAVAAFPWPSLAVLVLAVWVLRSGSVAASAVGDRRRLRGRRWYDGVRLLLATPWHLVRELGNTVLLELWGLALGVSAGAVCYAIRPGIGVALAVGGAGFVLGMWTGPGGAQLRSPVARVVRPLSRPLRSWAVALGLILVLGIAGGLRTEAAGTTWAPAHDRPFAGR